MKSMGVLGWLLPLSLMPLNVVAQGADAQKKIQELLASLNRKEHKIVDRRGVKAEKYLEIRSEPVVKSDVRDYSGRYLVTDIGYSLDIRMAGDGRVEGSGSERSRAGERKFVLKNGKIEGPLLTADKVFEDGSADRFEGVFINRTTLNSPDAGGVSAFGIGTLSRPVETNDGASRNKLFYRWQG
jgi:hypothetical protein